MKKPLIVANWKGYVLDREDALAKARTLARGAKKVTAQLIVCPPTPFIETIAQTLTRARIGLGSQTISTDGLPARTGEYTARMIRSLAASYTIVGHSERRAMGESDEQVCDKIAAALEVKLSPILCIGEESRDTSSGDHFSVIENQLRSALSHILPTDAKKIIVAYEPIWAIGKTAAEAMSAGELEETVLYIRKILVDLLGRAPALATPILYGGSVEPSNAEELMESGVAGFLVGHASVDPSSLLAIAQASVKTHGPVRNRGRSR